MDFELETIYLFPSLVPAMSWHRKAPNILLVRKFRKGKLIRIDASGQLVFFGKASQGSAQFEFSLTREQCDGAVAVT